MTPPSEAESLNPPLREVEEPSAPLQSNPKEPSPVTGTSPSRGSTPIHAPKSLCSDVEDTQGNSCATAGSKVQEAADVLSGGLHDITDEELLAIGLQYPETEP